MQESTCLSLTAAAWFFVGQSGEESTRKSVPIKTPLRVGRHPDSDLCLPCHSVSGSHAEILERDGQILLRDLNSTNGTFVNGDRIDVEVKLNESDTVQFGTLVFQVSRDQKSTTPRNAFLDVGQENPSDDGELFNRLVSGGVVPFFQPIMGLSGESDTIVGYEVLGRSKLYGLHTPAEMFAAASRLEMEAELSRVLRTQGIEVADKHLPKEHSLFVNTHPAEIECGGMIEGLFENRENHPDRQIMLEVHESFLNNAERFSVLRSNLDNLDIKLVFHDFGSGQIHLAELSEIRPDIVKLDIKLTQGIDKAPSKRQQFVATLVKMLRDLGIKPVAECIEQHDEHEILKQLGFEMGQGFYYGRPRSIEDCMPSSKRVPVVSEFIPQVKSFLDEIPAPAVGLDTKMDMSKSQPQDSDWLLAQPANSYTIQVMSAINEERALEHVAKQDNPKEFAIFCKKGKTRQLYIVVHGVFADRAAAKTVSTKLANAVISPWIRMLSSVHAEINAANEK